MMSLTEQVPVHAGTPAPRSLGALIPSLGRRAVRRLVAAFAPRAGQRSGQRPQHLPVSTATTMTIVIVDHGDVSWDATAVVTRLADLAVNDELVVVFGSSERWSGPHAPIVTAGLRERLPRHDVVALQMTTGHPDAMRRGVAVVGEFLEIGSLPVVVTQATVMCEVAEQLAGHLGADRILTVSCMTGGVDLYHIWPRPMAVSSQPF